LAVSRYCLDTSAYSRFRTADARVVQLVDQAEWIGMPSITLGELRAGFLAGTRREQNEALLQEFLVHPSVEVVNVDDRVSRHFAEIVGDLRRGGTPLPTNDIWIAATAVGAAAHVLTFDSHFEKIVRVGSVVLAG
jgi:predicted nucleic acid-binding protein